MPYVPKYPGAIPDKSDLPDQEDNVDSVEAKDVNDPKAELLAALNELGTDPSGSKANLKERLAVLLNDDGTLKRPAVVKDITTDEDLTHIDIDGLDINDDCGYEIYIRIKNAKNESANVLLYVEEEYTNTDYYIQRQYTTGTDNYVGRTNAPEIGGMGWGRPTVIKVNLFRMMDGYVGATVHEVRDRGSDVKLYFGSLSSTFTKTNFTKLRIASSVADGIAAGSRIIIKRLK
jgi:hypothetical protein